MSSRLSILRSRLSRLWRARAIVRVIAAWSALVNSVLIGLLVCLALDYLFQLAVSERVVVLAVTLTAVAWACWRFAWPLLNQQESPLHLALLVERQNEVDSDLVAALQFESPQAASWGSPQLTGAVIDYVVAATPAIDVYRGFNAGPLLRRGMLLAACFAIWLLLAAIAPRHLAVFMRRLCLASPHYPTRTTIDRILVNSNEVFSAGDAIPAPRNCKAAEGRPLTFVVEYSGQRPRSGQVVLTAAGQSKGQTRLDLKPSASIAYNRGNVLSAELPHLREDLIFQITAGDSWTEAARVQMIPLPVVDVKLKAKPPTYAVSRGSATAGPGRQQVVLEGSAIELALESKNKPLASAWLMLQAPQGVQRVDLTPSDSSHFHWTAPSAISPLAAIRRETPYEIQVIDEDGLNLDSPIRGRIRVQPDEPPTAAVQVIHKVVLPAAEPTIHYRATDDYGISRIALIVDVQRGAPEAATTEASDRAPRTTESHRFELLGGREPIRQGGLPVAASYRLPLSPLHLVKGDALKLTLEVIDYRGQDDRGEPIGKSAVSDSLVLQISDEGGVLAAISQADQRSEQQLTEIIKRQLGIGEAPQ